MDKKTFKEMSRYASRVMLLLTVLLAPQHVQAEELTVYDGTTTNSYIPLYGYYADDGTRSQFIIPATELADMTWGNIEKLTFYTPRSSTSFNEGFTVYMKEVDYTTFETATMEDWSTMSAVYTGSLSINDYQMVIDLDEPYNYEGGNLMIGIQVTEWGTYTPNVSWYGSNTTGSYTAVYNYANSSHVWNTSVTRQAFLPKTTFTYTPGEPPAVAKPTDLKATGTTAYTATISWTSDEAKWNLHYKEADVPEWNIIENLTEKTYTMTGLMSNTAYNVQVQAVNGTETSRWAKTTVTTAIGVPYKQAFEINNVPKGWNQYSGLLADVQAGTATLTPITNWGSDEYSWQFRNEKTFITFMSSGNRHWLVMPEIELGQASHLSFDLSLGGGYYGYSDLDTNNPDDRFIVLISIDGGANWTEFAVWDNAKSERVLNNIPADGETVTLNFPAAYAGKSITLAFYAESTVYNATNRLFIDNVVIDDPERCMEPVDLISDKVTSNTADVSWTAEGSLFNLQYKKDGDREWTTVRGINAKTYSMTGLKGNSTYIFRVQTDCGGSLSVWSEEASFTTKRGIPFTERFTTSNRPEEWTAYSVLMSEVLDGSTKLSEHVNTSAWGFSSDGYTYVSLRSKYEKQWLVTPDIMMDADDSQLTFDLLLRGFNNTLPDMTGTDDQFAVLVSTDAGDTWKQLALWNNSGSERVFNEISTTGEQVALDLSAYTGKTIRLAFYTESTVYNAENVIRVSNVSVDVTPDIDAHRPKSLAVSDVTKSKATVAWTADAAVTSWNVRYKTRTSSFWYDTTAETNSCTLVNLNAGNYYEVQVQAVIGDETSGWSKVLLLTDFPEGGCDISYVLKSKNEYGWNGTAIQIIDVMTGIEVAALTLEEGKAETTGNLELINGRNYRFDWLPKDYYGDCSYSFYDVNGDEFLYADAGKTGQKTTLISYKMDCTPVTCHQPKNPYAEEVSFYSATVKWTPGDEDQTKWEILCSTSYGTPSSSAVGTEVTETSYTFDGLKTNYTYYIYIRGIKGEEKSKWSRCVQITTKYDKATPTDVEGVNESFRTVDVDWTVNGIEKKWDLRYREDGTYGDFTVVNGITAHPYTIEGLTPETEYEVQVRAVYDNESTGIWSNTGYVWTRSEKAMPSDVMLIGMTAESAVIAWTKNGAESKWNLLYNEWEPTMTETFEKGLPDGWTTIDNDGDGYTWEISTEEGVYCHSGTACMNSASYINDVGAINPDNWLVTPQIPLGGFVKFWMRGQSDYDYKEHFAVYVSTTGTAVADFTIVKPETITTDEYTEYVVDLRAFSGQGYVAFRHFNCTDQFYLNLDDVTFIGPEDKWGMKNGLTEQGCILDRLTKGAMYEVQVQAVYDDESTSEWTDGYMFLMEILKGDADGDGVVDVNDVTTTINYILGKPYGSFNFDAANIDGDDAIDVNDVQGIIDIALGKDKKE